MGIFNEASRTKNVMKSSVIGVTGNLLNVLFGFIYRSIFLQILSAEYLGINGLFTNVLQILSLAEMGITTAITYRFYEPINQGDVEKVGKLMRFFKTVYMYIAIAILAIGLLILPFVKFFIKDTNEVPQDINLQLVYVLFLLNTVSSYLFVYKQTLLSADQKNYLVSIFQIISTIGKYVAQIAILFISRNYTLTLAIGIFVTILINFLLSVWITYKYKPVFEVQEKLAKDDSNEILDDTKACMLHKIGATVKTGTDNIVLAKMVSLVATGIYSNYSLIVSSIQNVLNQLLGNFISSIGNAKVNLDKERHYEIYKKLLFVDLWITSLITGCIYLLIDDFIILWIGEEYLLDDFTVILLCAQFYIAVSRIINISYTNGCGLFVKDKIRPVIEALLNLVISILLAYYIGIAGVFLGTVLSAVLTICWREPIILYKYEFEKKVSDYWITYFKFLLITIGSCCLMKMIKIKIFTIELSWFIWVLEGICVFIAINLILLILLHKEKEFTICIDVVKKVFNKFRKV